MSATSLESKLMLAQLHRYISGEELEPDVLQRLESELQTNPELRQAAEEFRQELLGKTGSKSAESKKPFKFSPKELIAAVRSGDMPFKGKPVYYTVSLGIVLVAMTAFLQDPTALFGPRASKMLDSDAEGQLMPSEAALAGAQEELEQTESEAPLDIEIEFSTGDAAESALEGIQSPDSESGPPRTTDSSESSAADQEDTVFVAESGQPVRRTTAPRPQRRSSPAPAAAPPAQKSGITVYDENGNRISP